MSELLPSAAAALRSILQADPHTYDNVAQSAFAKVQLQAAMHVIDGCLGMAAASGGPTTRKAAQILAAVGGDAVTKELARRYAAKHRSSERQRIVEAVPAEAHVSTQPMAAAADGGSDDATTRGEGSADT